VSTPQMTVRSDVAFVGHVVRGNDSAVFDPDARSSLVADVTVAHGRLFAKDDLVVTAEDVHGEVTTANNDLTTSFPLSSVRVSMASARAPNLAKLGAHLLPPDVTIRRGSATGSLKASWRTGAVDARADVEVSDAYVTTPKLDVAGRGKLWLAATSKDAASGIALSGSGLALDDIAVRVKDSRTNGLSLRADLADALLRVHGAHAFDGTVGVRLTPGDRVLGLLSSLASLPKELGEAPAGREAQATVRVHGGADGADVRVLDAHDGDLAARGRVRKGKHGDARGAFLLEVGVLRAGVEVAGGQTHVQPLASHEWLDEKTQ